MSSLKENLEALSTSLPDVPAELEALKARAERAERAVVDFLNDVGEKDVQAARQLHELKQALAAFGHESEDESHQLESQMDGLEERVESRLGELRGDQARLTQALAACGTAMVALEDVLVETGTTATTAAQDAVQELGDLEEGAGSAQQAMRAGVESVDTEAAALREAVEDGCASVRQAMDGLVQRMRDIAGQATHRIDQTAERLDALRAAHEAEVPEHRARLDDDQQAIANDLRGRIEIELKAHIAESAGMALAALDGMRAEGAEAVAACKSGHDALEAGLERLRDATRPMPQAIDAVKQAAVQVGLPWD
jgi:chromosome segregation ATPase